MTREEYEQDLDILYKDARKQGNTRLALEILECKRAIDTKPPSPVPLQVPESPVERIKWSAKIVNILGLRFSVTKEGNLVRLVVAEQKPVIDTNGNGGNSGVP